LCPLIFGGEQRRQLAIACLLKHLRGYNAHSAATSIAPVF
jgi:hypothetical protein